MAEERESSEIDARAGNGIFTKYFIEALETGNVRLSDSDQITIDAVYDYIHQHVSTQAMQEPQRFVIGGAGSFVVGRSSSGRWERRRLELIKRFGELLEQNVINDDQFVTARRIFRMPWSTMTIVQKNIGDSAVDLIDGKLSVTEFCMRLDQLSQMKPQPEERPSPEPQPDAKLKPEPQAKPQPEAERTKPKPGPAPLALPEDARRFFLIQGVVLLVLGVFAIIMPSVVSFNLRNQILGWMLVAKGLIGSVTTLGARQAPGFWCSLLVALLAIGAGILSISGTWYVFSPLYLFILTEGILFIICALTQWKQHLAGWQWMLVSGLVDWVLVTIVLLGYVYEFETLLGANLIVSGVSFVAIARHERLRIAARRLFKLDR